MAFFSIITVTLNAAKVINKTIQSILNQSFKDYEIIIKDGFSSDETLAMIPEDKRIKIVQSKDNGIYDAMNQAVRIAEGQYLCFLNAGDSFLNTDVLEGVFKRMQDAGMVDVFYGDYMRAGIVVKQPSKLSDFTLFRNQLNHQSMFFSSRIISEEVNSYNTNYHILADYELTVRHYKNGAIFIHIPVIVDEYEGNGISESKEGRKIYREENKNIRKQYFGKRYYLYNLAVWCTMPKIRGFVSSDSAPEWIRKAYSRIRNRLNNRGC